MSPRKKVKPNPIGNTEQPQREGKCEVKPQDSQSEPTPQSNVDSADSSALSPAGKPQPAKEKLESSAPRQASVNSEPDSRVSWYGGSWSRRPKATAVAQAAKDTLSATGDAVSEMVSASRAPKSPAISIKSSSLRIPSVLSASSRSLPLAATTTKVNISSNENDSIPPEQASRLNHTKDNGTNGLAGREAGTGSDTETTTTMNSASGITVGDATGIGASGSGLHNRNLSDTQGNSWLGWFYQSPGVKPDEKVTGAVSSNGVPDSTATTASGAVATESKPSIRPLEDNRSWLGVWRFSSQAQPERIPQGSSSSGTESKAGLIPGPENAKSPGMPTKSKGWAFWSTEESSPSRPSTERKRSTGELALAGSPSQNKPEKASIDNISADPAPAKASRGSRDKPSSIQEAKQTQAGQATQTDPAKVRDATPSEGKARSARTEQQAANQSQAKPILSSSSRAENLLLPSIQSCYGAPLKANLLHQIAAWLPTNQASSPKHLGMNPYPPKIRRALAIGIHGYFPAPVLRSILGQPTGTSIKFANAAASAIQRWCETRKLQCEIEKVALEGEGKIAERLDLLWDLLLNWIDKVRKADFILIACHSQGVPVANMLVARLLSFGVVTPARLGICAMAGINMGPFSELQSRWIGSTAAELFQFSDPNSTVSKSYRAAMETNLRRGVKSTYIGSIDDQLVSLESSTFGPVLHPCIYRAVFVDGKLHAPNFISHLVGFALKLRNLGISDHGLVRELSSPLAGSLYSGEGHSRIYDDDAVYDLAVRFALETTDMIDTPLHMSYIDTAPLNPYILPFSMRGVLEEEYVKDQLQDETMQLLRQFDDWKPSTKVLKDVKFRLEGVRSKI